MTENTGSKSGRPSKKAKQAVKEHEAPKIELKAQPAGPEEKKKLAILDEKMQIYHIYQGMVAGKSIAEVGEELSITPATVRAYIAHAIEVLNNEIASIKSNWAQIWIARTEMLVKKIHARLDNGAIVDKDIIDMLDKIQKMQERILGVGSGAPAAGVQINNTSIVQTVDNGSELWKYGMAEMQMRYAGQVKGELVDYIPDPNAEAEKLHGLLGDDD